ncbi:MAG: alpha-amylase [Bacteroidetes bacterium]|nr:alpha-amylase [Bacteroidota bacterium]
MLTSVKDLDLSPKPGKDYWKNSYREWREEFIYFLMVDRFHDNQDRRPESIPSRGFGNEEQLTAACGGTLKGITSHLDYIHDLGCTALWLSPVFENTPDSYHGYAISNYLNIDARFGTKEDLEELVKAAHRLEMRVFLDIVLHHSGDLWYYPGKCSYYYYDGASFPFEGWRTPDRPVPIELRNPDLYSKKGQIRNYDRYPETREGDFMELKAFRNDESPEALYVLDVLTKVHCYWIRETDIDGFRLDAVKHMGEKAISQFCSIVREYAYKLGKRNFFLFGELLGPDEMYDRYIGPKTSTFVDDKAIYYGLNSVLDFPLYHVLADVIKGKAAPEKLIDRYESLRLNALHRGEFGEFLVTFVDNHDQPGIEFKTRYGFDASEDQIIAAMGFLLCALGTPCIYYGTEQAFNGHGHGDWFLRQTMFDLDHPGVNALNKEGRLYRQIAKLAAMRKEHAALRFGRMYMRMQSPDGKDFELPSREGGIISFSRVLFDEEILVVFNSSPTFEREEYIEVDGHINEEGNTFHFLYGGEGEVHILKTQDPHHHFVRLLLKPCQFVLLSNR